MLCVQNRHDCSFYLFSKKCFHQLFVGSVFVVRRITEKLKYSENVGHRTRNGLLIGGDLIFSSIYQDRALFNFFADNSRTLEVYDLPSKKYVSVSFDLF